MTSSSAPAVPTRAIILTACATFGATANLRVADSLLPQVATEFGTTVGQASIIVTVYALAFGCFQMFYGPIGDRLGKLRVIMGVAFASALVTGLSAFMPTLHTLAGARFLTAVASAAIVPLGMAWVGDVVPYEQRQGVLARFLTGQIMGMAFGQAVGGVLGDLWGWRSVFGVLAAVHFLGGLGLAIEIWRNPKVDSGTGQRGGGLFAVFRSFASVLKRRWARTILLGVFLEGGAMFGAFAYVGADLHHRFGLDISLVGTLLIAYGFGGVIYAWTARPLLVWLGERGFAVIGGALVALGFVTLALAPTAHFAVPAILLMGYAYYMLHNTLQTNGTQMAPEARGVAMSLFASCFFLGQSTGVLLASLFIDKQGTVPIYFASALALTLIGIWFAGRLRHRP